LTDDIYREQIPEIKVAGRPLGRHIYRDARSLNFPADLAKQIVSVRHASSGLPLNQGDTGSCTAHGLCGALNTVPHWESGQPTLGEPDAYAAYSLEEQLEGFGPYPPADNGGSGTMVCKAAKQLGWLSSYQTADGIVAAIRALALRPVITGTNWLTSFDSPDLNGLVEITPNATVRGGHEYMRDEIIVPAGLTLTTDAEILANLDQILIGGFNSWGTSYGKGGRFYYTANTWQTLLERQGDVTVPRTKAGWVAKPGSSVSAVKGTTVLHVEPDFTKVLDLLEDEMGSRTISHISITKAAATAALAEAVGLAVAVVPNLAADKSILIAAGTSVIVAVTLVVNAVHAVAGAKLAAARRPLLEPIE
jgi:hypothetical protein